jgi:hypothetical protein
VGFVVVAPNGIVGLVESLVAAARRRR